jgi:hypothetical protein
VLGGGSAIIAGVRGILLLVMLGGCWRASNPTVPPPPEPAQPPPDAAPSEPISLVTSMVIVEACPDSKRLDTKLANREIDELVGPCKSVPGGAAHFSATLVPGGRVELASPSGDPSGGVVPTCLVQNAGQLRHKLRLTKPCKFDVRLEERTATLPK